MQDIENPYIELVNYNGMDRAWYQPWYMEGSSGMPDIYPAISLYADVWGVLGVL